MPEWTIEDENGNEYTQNFPKYISGRHGKQAFKKLDVKIQDGKINVDDTDSLLDCKEYIVKQMLNKADLDLSADELAMPSWNQIANYYFQQIVNSEKKSGS